MDRKRFLNLDSLFTKTGFTLIEVTVTLTILGLILLIIFGAFRLGLSAWERGESTREDYQKLRTVSDQVSRQIKSIVAYKIKSQKAEGDYLAFEGKSDSVKFVSALPIKAKQPEGLVYVIYEFKEGGEEEGRLVLYEERVLNRDFMNEEPKEESGFSVLEGISSMTFEYFREADPLKGQEEGWVEEWSAKEEKKIPRAIRAKITYKNGKNGKVKPPLTLFASIPAYRFEETKAASISRGLGGRTILKRNRP